MLSGAFLPGEPSWLIPVPLFLVGLVAQAPFNAITNSYILDPRFVSHMFDGYIGQVPFRPLPSFFSPATLPCFWVGRQIPPSLCVNSHVATWMDRALEANEFYTQGSIFAWDSACHSNGA